MGNLNNNSNLSEFCDKVLYELSIFLIEYGFNPIKDKLLLDWNFIDINTSKIFNDLENFYLIKIEFKRSNSIQFSYKLKLSTQKSNHIAILVEYVDPFLLNSDRSVKKVELIHTIENAENFYNVGDQSPYKHILELVINDFNKKYAVYNLRKKIGV